MGISEERGLTLLEVLLAITILTVVILPMLGFLGNSAKLVHQSEVKQVALTIAQQTMEDLKTNDFEELNNDLEISNETFSDDDLSNYPEFTRTINVEEQSSDFKTIEVIVYWNNQENQVSLKTLVANR